VDSYKQLRVWQRSIDLVEKIYEITRHFPKEETYTLTSQLRRAAISIPANLAEGTGRGGKKEYAHFVSIAYGSCCEIETLCIVCRRLNLISVDENSLLEALLADISRMLKALHKALVH
jgi:four helix bundle protein